MLVYNPSKLQIRKCIDKSSKIHKSHKMNILKKLIDCNKNLAKQGSLEWLASRKYNIGGSEMSVLTGDNPFMKIDQLVAQKVGFNKFTGNIATRWGKLFESVTQSITEIILPVVDRIHETGSLVGAVANQTYSPDGLGLVQIKCCETIDQEYIETMEYCIILFEYKSPFMSIPSGEIPKYYKPQVKTGLCSIPIIDFAIFINNMFRKCKYTDLHEYNINYDTVYHNKDSKKNFKPEYPLALGLISIYQSCDQKIAFRAKYHNFKEAKEPIQEYCLDNINDIFNHIYQDKNKNMSIKSLKHHIYHHTDEHVKITPIDFGDCHYTWFNELLELFDDNLVSISYGDPYVLDHYNNNDFISAQDIPINNKAYSNIDDFNNYTHKIILKKENIGYIPWKLFKSDIICEFRDDNYVSNYEHIIKDTIDKIKNINTQKDESDKIQLFKQYYPKSNTIKHIDKNLEADYVLQFLPD